MDPFEQPQRPRATPIPGSGLPLGHAPMPGPAPAPGWGPGPVPPGPWYPPAPGGAFPPGGFGPGPMGWGSSAPPGTNMVRKRRRVALGIGLIMLIGGIVAGTLGVLGIIDAVSIPDDEIPVRGRTGEPMSFARGDADPERWTVYVDSRSSDSDVANREAARTRCDVTLADGSRVRVDGSRQATSVNLDGKASIGYFDAPVGPVSVLCESSPGDHRVFVAEGGPRLGLSQFGLLFGGIGAVVVGVILTIIGARRRWVAVPAL